MPTKGHPKPIAALTRMSGDRRAIFEALQSEIKIADLCRITGFSREFVTRLRDRHVIQQTETGGYILGETLRALLDHYRSTSAKRKIRHEGSVDERNRLTAAQADIAEMNRGVMEGSLLPSDWVAEQYVKLAALFRQLVLSIPDAVATRMVKYLKEANRFEEVRAEIRDVAHEKAEEISALEINYETRPLKFRASGRPGSLEEDAEGDEASA